jgi:glutamyl-tRNA synthetase
MIRTRAAISPTGYPHIGTIYQVLFDYAYAKKHNGKFVVRIEDTDKERTVADAEKKVFEALDWFQISEDESVRKSGSNAPYRQSDRLTIYQKYAKELVEKKQAYYCFCSKERLEEVRKKMQLEKKVPMYDKHCRNLNIKDQISKIKNGQPYVIRLKVPENTTVIMKDELRGEIKFDSNGIDDQVLLKSDGYPTYFLAVTVDDHLMGITHMVRGEEWLTSSGKIILLYDYFGWAKPKFYHTPIIRNPDRSKFSKRQGHTNVSWYQEQGYFPEVILNYLALMGWSHPEGKEIFSLDEFIKVFDLKDISPVGPVFDLNKLEWMNGEYIRKAQSSKLKDQILKFYKNTLDEKIVEKTIPLIQERIKKLSDYLPLCEFFFKSPEVYEQDLRPHKELLKKMNEVINSLEKWTAEEINIKLVKLCEKEKIKTGDFFMILRVAIIGKRRTPPLNESMIILGKEECVLRINKLI